ncbi:HD domain-containing protein [Flavobacterium jejuense]|uniref:HD domain-containing protein n=1 Tax=Flavobacterium jejuense TaxID=1544455 RepID=A0ABX0IUQ4_9FLAO|nr:Pycsar system effector family protein [Flavobacterium jejuense]NHN27291.1 HD domain-containing protein [Flavobacterium jejuense]
MDIVELASIYVRELFDNKLPQNFVYHNYHHTVTVVKAVQEIIDAIEISYEDKEKLLISAWFHDTGYTECISNHEEKSAKIASDFLKDNNKNQNYIDDIKNLIMVTVFNYIPKTELEKIIKDADYVHFSKKEYIKTSELLRMEWEQTCNKCFFDKEWMLENYTLLKKKHHYYTNYAKNNWQKNKEENIKLIEKKIKNSQEMETQQAKESKKKNKTNKYDRSVDTMFRVTLSNHTRLSEIADSKANILLSVNAIIISIALSTIVPKLDSPNNAHLIFPTFIMVVFSVTSIIFAILSTRPKVTSGTFTKKDIEDRKVNLLFFGNFYKMPYEDYQSAINDMMTDNNYLYNSMIKDLYYLGIVLEKKYRLLRITYNIFMVGIVFSVIAFVIAFKVATV